MSDSTRDPIEVLLERFELEWCPDCAAQGRSGFCHVQGALLGDGCTHDDRRLTADEVVARRRAVRRALADLTPSTQAAAATEATAREAAALKTAKTLDPVQYVMDLVAEASAHFGAYDETLEEIEGAVRDLVQADLAGAIGARWEGGRWLLPYFHHEAPDEVLPVEEWVTRRRAAAAQLRGSAP